MGLINAFLVSILTEGAKRVQAIPLEPYQTNRIRAVAAVLSLVLTIVTAFLNGHLADASVLQIIGDTISTWLVSVLVYYGIVKQ